MTDELLYNLKIEVKNGADIESVEELLEDALLDLYGDDSVEAVIVKNRTPPIDEDLKELLDIIEDLDSDDVRGAIEYVRELEELE